MVITSIFTSTLYAVFSDHILFYDVVAICSLGGELKMLCSGNCWRINGSLFAIYRFLNADLKFYCSEILIKLFELLC